MSEPLFEEYQQRVSQGVEALEEEWFRSFSEWVASHRDRGFPCLSDEAIDRESIYGDAR
jgi:hypothetical protein